jgi:hypothetical protein
VPNEIESYQAAMNEYDAAKQKCQQLSNFISQAAKILHNWPKATVANVTGNFPPELVTRRSEASINGKDWPTAQQIADALCDFHAKQLAMSNAYDRIPQSQRGVVVGPERRYEIQNF